jgi:hypothetical protein
LLRVGVIESASPTPWPNHQLLIAVRPIQLRGCLDEQPVEHDKIIPGKFDQA